MSSGIDFLIVGQGLAGTSLAWQLIDRGARVLVIDREESETSSRVAAGIVNPITGRHLAKSWRVDQLWPVARRFYRSIEARTDAAFFRETPVWRLFHSAKQREQFVERQHDAPYRNYIAHADLDGFDSAVECHTEHGGFATANSAWLDVPGYLDASRAALSSQDAYHTGEYDADAVSGDVVVFCEGHEAAQNALFDGIPFKSAKGEILDLTIADFRPKGIVNRGGVWILPLGGNRFRAGATYSWSPLDTKPSKAARAEIEERLRRVLRIPYEITGQRAAVRPIVNASKVLLGIHPARPNVAFFNGLGSKGVLSAPYFAAHLADHLVDRTPIDPEVDLRKNH